MSKKDSLGDRQKRYEKVSEHYLIKRMPVIIRLDGKAFHTFTKPLKDPFDNRMHECMKWTMIYLCQNIQGAVFGYTQSDEISILLKDWQTLDTDAWFDNRQNKIESVSAGMASANFNALKEEHLPDIKRLAFFDSRAFNVPKEDVVNYFVWRQQDAIRNSVQMLGRQFFSHRELHRKSNTNIQDMLLDKHGIDWTDLDTWKKRGTCWYKTPNTEEDLEGFHDVIDNGTPVFQHNRDFISKYLD